MERIKELIKKLDLQPHPEGGYFKETYRSSEEISHSELSDNYSGNRNVSTCIYFLLTSDMFSAFHKINQDEIWHFYEGSPIELHTISEDGHHSKYIIGGDFSSGQTPQLVVRGGNYFAARILEKDSYALVGCTVAPGFDFDDFVLPSFEELRAKFPEHEQLIKNFTHS